MGWAHSIISTHNWIQLNSQLNTTQPTIQHSSTRIKSRLNATQRKSELNVTERSTQLNSTPSSIQLSSWNQLNSQLNSTQLTTEHNSANYSTQLNSNQLSTLLPTRGASFLLASLPWRASVAYISGCEYDDRGDMDTKVAFLDLFEEVQGLAWGRLLGHIWSARRAHLGSNRSSIAVESELIF